MSGTATTRVARQQIIPIALLALVITGIAQFAGALNIDVGIGAIVIFPMVWGLIAGLLVSIQKFKPLGLDMQKAAAALVGIAVFVLVGRLAFNIGPSLELLLSAGPALLLQEVGHLLGTIALALPLAVALRMGTATIGATFSLDREPSFAIVSEKYGADSHQYRGVLSMYVFGTLFGAVFITLLTSIVTSWGVFDPLALAMGAGVGSGSMMIASAGTIAAAYPAQEEAILAMASVSNLITTLFGVYFGIWVALPLADRFYHLLTGGKHRKQEALTDSSRTDSSRTGLSHTGKSAQESAKETQRNTEGTQRNAKAISEAEAAENRALISSIQKASSVVSVPLGIGLTVVTVLGLVTAFIAVKSFDLRIVVGYVILVVLTLVGIALARLTRGKVAAVVWITTIGTYLSSPWFFASEWLVEQVSSIDVLSVATVMLTLAGLSLGKDLPLLRSIGWKIIPVGLVAITASFFFSTVIAEFALGFWG